MMANHCRNVFALVVVIAIGGCVPQSTLPIPSATINAATSMPLSNTSPTDTPRPEKTPTIAPTATHIQTLTSEPILVSRWFSIPKLTHPDTIDLSSTRAFKGIRIPPLPAELVIEFQMNQPYGEVPVGTIFYQLFLVRKENTRMLWLGVPFKEISVGQETPYRIYDSIPFPAVETDSLLIPFVCRRNQEPDLFLIVVAERPVNGRSATNIRYAWRIDQASISLKPVSTDSIECSPDW
jgi:hypothetical protein